MWTAGWVEPGDKWMLVTSLGDGLAVITHLLAAPNPLVGPLTVGEHLVVLCRGTLSLTCSVVFCSHADAF